MSKSTKTAAFTISWDENDPQESIFNNWTKQDFIDYLNTRIQESLAVDEYCGKDPEKSGEKSKGSSNITEATKEDYEDFWYNSESEGKDFKDYFYAPENYGTWKTQEETFGIEGDGSRKKENFPWIETFPIYLKNETEDKKCWFTCIEHAQKYVDRHNPKYKCYQYTGK